MGPTYLVVLTGSGDPRMSYAHVLYSGDDPDEAQHAYNKARRDERDRRDSAAKGTVYLTTVRAEAKPSWRSSATRAAPRWSPPSRSGRSRSHAR